MAIGGKISLPLTKSFKLFMARDRVTGMAVQCFHKHKAKGDESKHGMRKSWTWNDRQHGEHQHNINVDRGIRIWEGEKFLYEERENWKDEVECLTRMTEEKIRETEKLKWEPALKKQNKAKEDVKKDATNHIIMWKEENIKNMFDPRQIIQ